MGIKLSVGKLVAGKYSDEDIQPHDTVAAIFIRGTGEDAKYLTEDHVKHNMLCPVIGKVKKDQTTIEALKAEVKEETNLDIKQFAEILNYDMSYDFGGNKVKVKTHLFKIIQYTGVLKNAEPKKHRWIKWLTRKEIEKSKRKIADAYLFYFKWLDDVNTPSLVKPDVKVGQGR